MASEILMLDFERGSGRTLFEFATTDWLKELIVDVGAKYVAQQLEPRTTYAGGD